MDIRGQLKEIEAITQEIKRINAHKKRLTTRKKELEAYILTFLESKDQTGVKYQGTMAVAKEKVVRRRRKKSERIAKGEEVLRNYGINVPGRVIKEVVEAMKGEPEASTSLKINSC